MLPCAVTESLEIVVKTINLLNRFTRRFNRLERKHVAEEPGIDVLLARRRRVKIKVARQNPCVLKHLRYIGRARSDAPRNLRNVRHTALVKGYDLVFLRTRLR